MKSGKLEREKSRLARLSGTWIHIDGMFSSVGNDKILSSQHDAFIQCSEDIVDGSFASSTQWSVLLTAMHIGSKHRSV